MNKYIVLVSLSNDLGGAQIRYLSLYCEISKRQNDYTLVINRKLYEIARSTGNLADHSGKIEIMEIDQLTNNTRNENVTRIDKRKKKSRIRILLNRILTTCKLVKYTYQLHLIFKKNKPDYVYSVWVGGMIAWPLKYLYKFKLVYSYMDSGFSSLNSFWEAPLKSEQLPLKHSDTIDFLSADLYKGVMDKVKLKAKNTISITPCSFKNYDNIVPYHPKKNTVTFCSRMTAIKNPMLLLESIKVFNSNYKNWKETNFQFLGNGECMTQMQEFIEKHKLANIELLGEVKNPVDYLSKSKIFVSIQQSNNYPSQSLMEAMACENAIIASDVGETRKLVTEKEGVLVKLDLNTISNAIIMLLTNNEQCAELGKQGRLKVLKEHTVDLYLDYFYSLEKI
ncbi:glycosyltransferase [Patiriisocius sp. Uisw_017]|uniref:glycosyltransferase n=1 Tax=Patiriisocius sp. Uisw_017 TaxID=3230968 RepID=UPI0039ED957C